MDEHTKKSPAVPPCWLVQLIFKCSKCSFSDIKVCLCFVLCVVTRLKHVKCCLLFSRGIEKRYNVHAKLIKTCKVKHSVDTVYSCSIKYVRNIIIIFINSNHFFFCKYQIWNCICFFSMEPKVQNFVTNHNKLSDVYSFQRLLICTMCVF